MSTWIEQVKDSMPEYAEDIGINLETFMATAELDIVDAHACALAAAIASGNGGLAFEIDMNSPVHKTPERYAAKSAAITTVQDSMYMFFANAPLNVNYIPPNFSTIAFNNSGGVTRQKYTMYSLAAAVVCKNQDTIDHYVKSAINDKCSLAQIQAVAKIAAVIGTIGNIVI